MHRFAGLGTGMSAAVRPALQVLAAAGLLAMAVTVGRAQEVPAYRNPKLPVDQRVADLLSRMTLEEKVAQMEGAWENKDFHKDPQTMFVDDKGTFLPERAAVLTKDGLRADSPPHTNRRQNTYTSEAENHA